VRDLHVGAHQRLHHVPEQMTPLLESVWDTGNFFAVKDQIRLWKEGVRDLVKEVCWVRRNLRVRLSPGQSMV
jgi:hypothetical protein